MRASAGCTARAPCPRDGADAATGRAAAESRTASKMPHEAWGERPGAVAIEAVSLDCAYLHVTTLLQELAMCGLTSCLVSKHRPKSSARHRGGRSEGPDRGPVSSWGCCGS